MRNALTLLLLATAVAWPASAQTGEVRGIIRAADGDAPVGLPFSLVEILDVEIGRAHV